MWVSGGGLEVGQLAYLVKLIDCEGRSSGDLGKNG
jgi:hypothetical protein